MRGSCEEDLSTEHPQAQQDPWLSQADEHARGSVGHQEAAAEGAQAPLRLDRRPMASQAPPPLPFFRLPAHLPAGELDGLPLPRALLVQASRRGGRGGAEAGPVGLEEAGRRRRPQPRQTSAPRGRPGLRGASGRGVRSRRDRATATARPRRARERRRERRWSARPCASSSSRAGVLGEATEA